MSTFKKAKILVVGGAGFIGSNLVRQLLAEEPVKICIVDNLLSAQVENVPQDQRVEFVYGTIADDRLLESIGGDFDYVFHLACFHGNQSSIADPIADHDNNTLTTLKLFNHLRDYRTVKKVVYAAAGCAVAEKTFTQATATAEDAPISLFHDSPYSISKLVGEMYANYFFLRYALPVVRTRFQNCYGPREILGAGRWRGTPHTVWRNVTPTFVWKSLHKEALPLENGGESSRDFIYVEDLAEGLRLAAQDGDPGEVYNLASGRETRIRELARLINELSGNETPVAMKPARNWDRSGLRFGSTEKAKRVLGFEARTQICDGLSRTIEWTKQHRELIGRCIAQHDYFLKNPQVTA